MKNKIKKILKEDDGLDWIKSSKGEDSILDFVQDRIKDPKYRYLSSYSNNKMYYLFDEVHSALAFLESDLRIASKASKELIKGGSYSSLMTNLDTIEDYIDVGDMIQSLRFGLNFFKPFIEEHGLPLEKILRYLLTYYYKIT